MSYGGRAEGWSDDLSHVGYRYWTVADDGRLYSPTALGGGYEWDVGQIEAGCRNIPPCAPGTPVGAHCGCGFYACSRMQNFEGYFSPDGDVYGYGPAGRCGGRIALVGLIRMSSTHRRSFDIIKSRAVRIDALLLPSQPDRRCRRFARCAAIRYEVPLVATVEELEAIASGSSTSVRDRSRRWGRRPREAVSH